MKVTAALGALQRLPRRGQTCESWVRGWLEAASRARPRFAGGSEFRKKTTARGPTPPPQEKLPRERACACPARVPPQLLTSSSFAASHAAADDQLSISSASRAHRVHYCNGGGSSLVPARAFSPKLCIDSDSGMHSAGTSPLVLCARVRLIARGRHGAYAPTFLSPLTAAAGRRGAETALTRLSVRAQRRSADHQLPQSCSSWCC